VPVTPLRDGVAALSDAATTPLSSAGDATFHRRLRDSCQFDADATRPFAWIQILQRPTGRAPYSPPTTL